MRYTIKTITIQLNVREKRGKQTEITTSKEAYKVLKEIFKPLDADQEHAVLLALNSRNEITGYKIISSGGQDSSIIDPKIIFRNALFLGASCIILAHNHPSTDLEPSEDDITMTHKIIKGGKMLEILLLDHIIITSKGYYSMAEKGLLKQ